jgi:hypothetical protein
VQNLRWSFPLMLALLAGCRGYGLNERNYADEGVQWGQSVNGLQVGLARRNYTPGTEPGTGQIYLTVQLRNASNQLLSILAPATISGTVPEKRAGDESVSVKLAYDSAAGMKTAEFTPPNKPVVQVMEPGKTYNLEVRLSPGRVGLDRFVSGRITAIYSNAQQTIKYDAMGEANKGLWTGEARSGTVKLDATPAATQEAKQGGGAPK